MSAPALAAPPERRPRHALFAIFFTLLSCLMLGAFVSLVAALVMQQSYSLAVVLLCVGSALARAPERVAHEHGHAALDAWRARRTERRAVRDAAPWQALVAAHAPTRLLDVSALRRGGVA